MDSYPILQQFLSPLQLKGKRNKETPSLPKLSVDVSRGFRKALHMEWHNKVDYNVKKCKLIRVTMKKQSLISNFALKGSVLEEVDEFRDLDFLTNHRLSWNSHVDTISSRANGILGLIKRTCRGWKDTETMKTLSKYRVWIGNVVTLYLKKNWQIRAHQGRETKFILGQNKIRYKDCLKCINMPSLEKRRYLFVMLYSCAKLLMAILA